MTLNKRMDELRELLNVTEIKRKILLYVGIIISSGEFPGVIKLKYHLYAFHIVRSKIVV